jgi:hypothetical protein
MSGFAARTKVSVEATRAEIERVLRRYGADAFGYSMDGSRAMIAFRIGVRHVRFLLDLPDADQPRRQRWRALLLVMKAKLEAVSAGITTIEDEFLAHTLLSDGRTVGEAIGPQITEHYRVGGPPSLMLEGPRS